MTEPSVAELDYDDTYDDDRTAADGDPYGWLCEDIDWEHDND